MINPNMIRHYVPFIKLSGLKIDRSKFLLSHPHNISLGHPNSSMVRRHISCSLGILNLSASNHLLTEIAA